MLLEATTESLHRRILDLEHENKSLRQEVNNSQIFLENSPTFISFLSPDKEIKFINKQLASFSGKNAIEFNNTYLSDDIHPEYRSYLSDNLDIAYKTHTILDVKFQIKSKNNQYVWFHSIGNPIYNNNNVFIGYICTSYDITQNEEDHLKLTELIDSNHRLFSIIGHDLRNSFNSILGFSELLAENAQDFETSKIKSIGKHLQNASKKTLDLLEDLLEWGQLQSTLNTFTPETLVLKKVCKKVISTIIQLDKNNTERIKIVFKSDIIVFADVNMLRTVFRNLLSNALKYSTCSSPITITAYTTQNNVVINILDQGLGIDPSGISKLFNSKEKHTSLGVLGEKGTGIGLLLCKEFVEKNGGEIWVKSTLGKGSEFSFSLPLGKNNKRNN
ncbi:MAG: hypothetical protein COB98_01015 [Flavobacteriaceae bacterium]|nr:MAG: hypothetical protein COB98_01015 [Flavobacteriaceae bacterium]